MGIVVTIAGCLVLGLGVIGFKAAEHYDEASGILALFFVITGMLLLSEGIPMIWP